MSSSRRQSYLHGRNQSLPSRLYHFQAGRTNVAQVLTRVEPFFFYSRKCWILCIWRIFVKIVQTFSQKNHQILVVFATRIKQQICSKCLAHLLLFYNYIRKIFGKHIFREPFGKNKYFSKESSQNLMSSKYFHKNRPFISHVADKPFLFSK